MPYLHKLNSKPDGCLKRREYDIIKGAEEANLDEVRGAIGEDADSINIQDSDTGLSALHIASADRNISIFNELVKHRNLKIDLLDHWKRTPIDLAIAAGHLDIVDRLMALSFPKFFESDADPYPPLPPNAVRFPRP